MIESFWQITARWWEDRDEFTETVFPACGEEIGRCHVPLPRFLFLIHFFRWKYVFTCFFTTLVTSSNFLLLSTIANLSFCKKIEETKCLCDSFMIFNKNTFICNVAQSIETTSTREMAMQWWERLRLWTWWWERLCCCLGEVVFGCFLILDYVCAERGGGVDLFSHPSDFETSDFAYEGAGGNRFHINRGKRGGGKSVFTSLRFWTLMKPCALIK